MRKSLERTQRKDPYYLAGCDRKSTGAEHRPGVMPEEDKIVFMILRETGFTFQRLITLSVDNFCLIQFYWDNWLYISRSVSRSKPVCVLSQHPHEDVPVCGKGVPRNDCSAILSKGCITALLSESSTEVDTYPSQQLVSMGENKEFPWRRYRLTTG